MHSSALLVFQLAHSSHECLLPWNKLCVAMCVHTHVCMCNTVCTDTLGKGASQMCKPCGAVSRSTAGS